MSTPLSATEVLDREFLDMRAALLQLAAALDRIQRAPGALEKRDAPHRQIREAMEILASTESDRVERIQLAFSLPYDRDWPARYDLKLSP
jgi:hypothetical protein